MQRQRLAYICAGMAEGEDLAWIVRPLQAWGEEPIVFEAITIKIIYSNVSEYDPKKEA
jgi:hypothetical protein